MCASANGGSDTVLVILIAVVAVTVVAMTLIRRPVRQDLSALPWDIADAARRQIGILTAQGAVAVTALVLLVTLSSKSAIQSDSFNTVVVMFLIAFLWFVGVAIEFTYIPVEGGPEGALLPRVLFVIAGIQHYRTLFLSWLALKPLVDTFHLGEAASVLSWLLGAGVLTGWLIVASVCYRSGVLDAVGALLAPAAGVVLALALFALARQVAPGPAYRDALTLSLAIFVLNAVSFGIQALSPMVHRRMGTSAIERGARVFVLADLQATVVVLALLWLTLLQPL